jgi:hypothetical protein
MCGVYTQNKRASQHSAWPASQQRAEHAKSAVLHTAAAAALQRPLVHTNKVPTAKLICAFIVMLMETCLAALLQHPFPRQNNPPIQPKTTPCCPDSRRQQTTYHAEAEPSLRTPFQACTQPYCSIPFPAKLTNPCSPKQRHAVVKADGGKLVTMQKPERNVPKNCLVRSSSRLLLPQAVQAH